MKRLATPPPPLDGPAILARARVLLFRLRHAPAAAAINPRAAAAVGYGRHGAAGQRFAEKIIRDRELAQDLAKADEPGLSPIIIAAWKRNALDGAIFRALTKGKP